MYTGVSIARNRFIVGQSATAMCASDTLPTRIEWLTNGEVVANAISAQTLPLLFSSVNDSIHEQVYVCRVTRDGIVAAQNINVQAKGKNYRTLYSSHTDTPLQFLTMLSKSVLKDQALPELEKCIHSFVMCQLLLVV